MSYPTARPKTATAILGQELTLTVVKGSPLPLYRQIYESLRNAILNGRLRPGARLPASRVLARDLAVSRTTASLAYEQLLAEGYLQARRGAGTFVTADLPDSGPARPAETPAHPPPPMPPLSERAQKLTVFSTGNRTERVSNKLLAPGTPAVDAFPFALWARIMARLWRHPPPEWTRQKDPFGYLPLREAIAEYLNAARSVRAQAEQIMIVSGSQQAIALCARALLNPGDGAVIENPAYEGTIKALIGADARPLPVACDDQGLCVGQLSERFGETENIRLICVTPSSLYPLGTAMALNRRLALLDWAERHGAWIVEDDYDADFSLNGRGIAAMQGLDRGGRVFYTGTFSQVLFPSLRLGYVVIPEALTDTFRALRAANDSHSPIVAQPVLAEFMLKGHFSAHRRRMRQLYRRRRLILLNSLEEQAAGLLQSQDRGAGLHIIAESRIPGLNETAIARIAARAGFGIRDLTGYFAATDHPVAPLARGMLVGFGGQEEEAIKNAVSRLCHILRQHIK